LDTLNQFLFLVIYFYLDLRERKSSMIDYGRCTCDSMCVSVSIPSLNSSRFVLRACHKREREQGGEEEQ